MLQKKKTIALAARDNKKEDLLEWVGPKARIEH